MELDESEFRVGTFHGSHDGAPVEVTATRDDTRSEPYTWTCTCGVTRSFTTEDAVFPTAWRHTHPGRLDWLRQWAARLLRTRQPR
ncbi:hypothetical protein ACGFNX_33625 [Streptomyces sp. NPDC048723]|uniref:hypothetical protein n=1 Tax=Streptomyces sp. NPDC048723 TaxID=3365589 RepID=UPI003714972F